MNRRNELPRILEANIFYLVIAIALIFLGAEAQRKDIYIGLLITEYIIILLPTLSYLKFRGYSLRNVLRINKLSVGQIWRIPLIVLLSYPIGIFLNAIIAIILRIFGEPIPSPLPLPSTGGEYLIGLLIISLSAGICEEVMFRGLVMRSYEKYGVKKAFIISGILFGFFHFNIQNLLGPIFLGILFGYMVYKTNSLFASILAHAANNAIAWTLSYLIGIISTKFNIDIQAGSEAVSQIPPIANIVIGLIFIGLILITPLMGVGAYYLLKSLPKGEHTIFNNACVEEESRKKANKYGLIKYIPIFVVGVLYVYFTILLISKMRGI